MPGREPNGAYGAQPHPLLGPRRFWQRPGSGRSVPKVTNRGVEHLRDPPDKELEDVFVHQRPVDEEGGGGGVHDLSICIEAAGRRPGGTAPTM